MWPKFASQWAKSALSPDDPRREVTPQQRPVAGGFEHTQQLWGVRIVARVLIGAELGEKYGVGQGAFWIAKHDRRQRLDPENLFESIRRVAVIERQADQHRVETAGLQRGGR